MSFFARNSSGPGTAQGSRQAEAQPGQAARAADADPGAPVRNPRREDVPQHESRLLLDQGKPGAQPRPLGSARTVSPVAALHQQVQATQDGGSTGTVPSASVAVGRGLVAAQQQPAAPNTQAAPRAKTGQAEAVVAQAAMEARPADSAGDPVSQEAVPEAAAGEGAPQFRQHRSRDFQPQAADSHASESQASESQGVDWWFFVLVVMLLGIGLVMVLSASGIVAEDRYGDKYYFFKRQLLYAGLGAVTMGLATIVPRGLIYKIHYVALFIVLLLMLLTLSPLSPAINGAHRWIRLGPVSIQPMEFVKIALALYLAYFMSDKQELVKTFSRGVIPPFAVTGLFGLLLMLQPDFGSTMVLALLLFVMCIVGGTRVIYLFFAGILVVAGGAALAIFEPYRMRRLLAFVDPFQDAQNTGYQLVQSLLAIGSGSFFGVGMGASRQKMFYLPEAHNDFIMAVLAEEMGFVGVSIVLLLFGCLFWRCYLIVRGQADLRGRYTAFALTCVLVFGVLMNLAVVMGVAPPKGVPMPLLSYGGSNLLATMLCLGLLLNFSRTARMGP